MIGEESFKGFCRHAEDGTAIRALYIVRDAPARRQQHLDMLNMCTARDLNPIYYEKDKRIEVNNAVAYLRIAHPYLDRELKAHQWHFIHGLEYLHDFEDGDAIRANLEMMVRL